LQTFNQAIEAVESYSPAEERFNRRRRTAGLALGPAALLLLLAAPLPLTVPAHRMAAIMALVIVFWITEALPMAVTAMLGPVLAVVMGVSEARAALAPFADPIIFLFIGSFILAEAMFVHGVDRRIAYTALSLRFVGTSATRVLVVYGAVATALSMWISNTATTAMMFPIGLSIVNHLSHLAPKNEGARRDVRRFAIGLMLMTSFGASVGGMATPVGTPPNLIGIGMLDRLAHVRVSFFAWTALGLPLVAVLFVFLAVLFSVTCAGSMPIGEGSSTLVASELRKLGRVSRAERNVLAAFGLTVILWITPGLLTAAGLDTTSFGRRYERMMPEGVAAMIGAFTLFVLPVEWRSRRFTLTWEQAVRIDWGIVFLYGGGLSIGALAFSTGLATAMGHAVTDWLPTHSTLTLTVIFTGVAIVLSEATSNTASANMVVPIAIAVAQAAGVRPIEPALGATFGASMGFMMPISTAPNAIVYSSGYVPITAMMRYGIALDLVAFVLIVLMVTLGAPVLF
jgi:sodium-dependent dicarboxylate transporter 2/3/5